VSHEDLRAPLKQARRIVVKVGSSTLTRDGALRTRKFSELSGQIANLREQNREVVLVSSGAIAIGSHQLGWSHPGRSIPEKQAAAAVGQIGLIELYQRRFAKRGISVAQILVTRGGLDDRERFLNARHTILELLRLGVVPIVNENDTVATEEIRFGDNDNLSATLVNLASADLLVILTDVDGLHERRPEKGQPKPPLISTVEAITPEVEQAASGSGSSFGSGGMLTKLQAAQSASQSGANTVLCNGSTARVLERVVAGEDIGTLFPARERLASRKHWLAFTTQTRGELVLDAGATRALEERGRSLLPTGITEVRGNFRAGDSVVCIDPSGREFARGLCAYPSQEILRIKGLETAEISRVLGYSNGDEIIHRDDFVLLKSVREV
jgi:glutamate 5-kinase